MGARGGSRCRHLRAYNPEIIFGVHLLDVCVGSGTHGRIPCPFYDGEEGQDEGGFPLCWQAKFWAERHECPWMYNHPGILMFVPASADLGESSMLDLDEDAQWDLRLKVDSCDRGSREEAGERRALGEARRWQPRSEARDRRSRGEARGRRSRGDARDRGSRGEAPSSGQGPEGESWRRSEEARDRGSPGDPPSSSKGPDGASWRRSEEDAVESSDSDGEGTAWWSRKRTVEEARNHVAKTRRRCRETGAGTKDLMELWEDLRHYREYLYDPSPLLVYIAFVYLYAWQLYEYNIAIPALSSAQNYRTDAINRTVLYRTVP